MILTENYLKWCKKIVGALMDLWRIFHFCNSILSQDEHTDQFLINYNCVQKLKSSRIYTPVYCLTSNLTCGCGIQ